MSGILVWILGRTNLCETFLALDSGDLDSQYNSKKGKDVYEYTTETLKMTC